MSDTVFKVRNKKTGQYLCPRPVGSQWSKNGKAWSTERALKTIIGQRKTGLTRPTCYTDKKGKTQYGKEWKDEELVDNIEVLQIDSNGSTSISLRDFYHVSKVH